MKIFKNAWIFLFLFLNIFSYAEEKLVFGITVGKNYAADEHRIRKLADNMINKMNVEYKKDFGAIFYDDQESLLKDFKDKKDINAVVIYPDFYFENRELIKNISKNPFIYKSSASNNSQLFLIANKNSKIDSINDIKNKTFMNADFNDTYWTWLDYLTLKNLNKPYKKVIGNQLMSSKSSTALLDVYFNKADFCIIEKDTYTNMLILNPSLEKKLKIIAKSPEIFFSALTVIQKDASLELISLINQIVGNKTFKDDFKEFLKLINLDSASRIEFKDLKNYETFYSEYKSLKEKE
jgi:ABC-type phosphate/phosphonate transport system substrate-binding protein